MDMDSLYDPYMYRRNAVTITKDMCAIIALWTYHVTSGALAACRPIYAAPVNAPPTITRSGITSGLMDRFANRESADILLQETGNRYYGNDSRMWYVSSCRLQSFGIILYPHYASKVQHLKNIIRVCFDHHTTLQIQICKSTVVALLMWSMSAYIVEANDSNRPFYHV